MVDVSIDGEEWMIHEGMDNALEIDDFYDLMCNRSGDNQQMVEETEEQKCIYAIICYSMGVIMYNNCVIKNSVMSLKI